ncbi:AAEL000002-PA [Aedes aegypti]|uniref:AAEL000002-PA n=1 Tax=Aedes aegypti TaxID=7159 RepID=Q0C7A9_AEDAE|nr:AAEL000002-PA [Aedes aegypti]
MVSIAARLGDKVGNRKQFLCQTMLLTQQIDLDLVLRSFRCSKNRWLGKNCLQYRNCVRKPTIAMF